MSDNVTSEERQALLVEYQVCEQDNVANFQGFWTLAAIFIGLSSAFLAGLIYAVIANKSVFNLIQEQNDTKGILISVIAFIIGIANVIILNKVKGWQTRVQFNLGVNNQRMREIDLILSMRKAWRTYAIDRWYETLKNKENRRKNDQEKWDVLEKKLKSSLDSKYHEELQKIIGETKEIINQYFCSGRVIDREGKFEIWSSKKHFPCILHTLMFLWVLVISSATLFMLADNNHFNIGWSLFVLITLLGLLIIFWDKAYKFTKKVWKKCKEYYFDP